MSELTDITHAFTDRELLGFVAGLLVVGVAVGMVLAVALFAIAV